MSGSSGVAEVCHARPARCMRTPTADPTSTSQACSWRTGSCTSKGPRPSTQQRPRHADCTRTRCRPTSVNPCRTPLSGYTLRGSRRCGPTPCRRWRTPHPLESPLLRKAQDHVALASATTACPTTVEDHPIRADDWPDRQCRSMPTTAPRAGKQCGDSGGTFSTMSPRMRVLMSATDVTSPSWGQNNPTGSKSPPGRASQARPISRPWGQPKTLPRHPASLCSSSQTRGGDLPSASVTPGCLLPTSRRHGRR